MACIFIVVLIITEYNYLRDPMVLLSSSFTRYIYSNKIEITRYRRMKKLSHEKKEIINI